MDITYFLVGIVCGLFLNEIFRYQPKPRTEKFRAEKAPDGQYTSCRSCKWNDQAEAGAVWDRCRHHAARVSDPRAMSANLGPTKDPDGSHLRSGNVRMFGNCGRQAKLFEPKALPTVKRNLT